MLVAAVVVVVVVGSLGHWCHRESWSPGSLRPNWDTRVPEPSSQIVRAPPAQSVPPAAISWFVPLAQHYFMGYLRREPGNWEEEKNEAQTYITLLRSLLARGDFCGERVGGRRFFARMLPGRKHKMFKMWWLLFLLDIIRLLRWCVCECVGFIEGGNKGGRFLVLS